MKVGLKHLRSGKVRDLYDAGRDRLLVVASDRLSAFDVVLDDPVPDKGRVLTALSTFWFEQTRDVVANHLISADPTDFPETAGPDVAGRAMLVRRATVVPMECVVRGYLFGSAWKQYEATGEVQGQRLPSDLALADPLPEPIFTPTTKADEGHDLPLTPDEGRAPRGGRALRRAVGRRSRPVRPGCRPRRVVRRPHRRHQVRVRRRRRRAGGGRRDADPRLLALLAGRGLAARPSAAVVRQAVRARLARRDGLGPQPAGAASCRATSSTGPAGATSRRTSCSPAAASTTGTGRSTARTASPTAPLFRPTFRSLRSLST